MCGHKRHCTACFKLISAVAVFYFTSFANCLFAYQPQTWNWFWSGRGQVWTHELKAGHLSSDHSQHILMPGLNRALQNQWNSFNNKWTNTPLSLSLNKRCILLPRRHGRDPPCFFARTRRSEKETWLRTSPWLLPRHNIETFETLAVLLSPSAVMVCVFPKQPLVLLGKWNHV